MKRKSLALKGNGVALSRPDFSYKGRHGTKIRPMLPKKKDVVLKRKVSPYKVQFCHEEENIAIKRNGGTRGELSYLAPLGSEKISTPYFKQCLIRGGVLPPRLSQTPRPPVPRQK